MSGNRLSLISILLSCNNVVLSQTFSLSGSTIEYNKGNYNQTVSLQVDTVNNLVEITLTGSSTSWMGTGWGSDEMTNTYAIVADGIDSNVGEWRLNSNNRGSKLSNSITVISDVINNNNKIRTVVLQRNANGASNDYYTFPTKPADIEIIWAYGPTDQPYFNTSTKMENANKAKLYLTSN